MLDGTYADLKIIDGKSGLSIWLHACIIAIPDLLQKMLAAGCDVAETSEDSYGLRRRTEGYVHGWNCLFFLVLHASCPESSGEFESLQLLLSAGADPCLRDGDGCTIFDYVDADTDYKLAEYQRELWYSALARAHIGVDPRKETRRTSALPVYNGWFEPVHHRALRYLRSWDESNVESQVNQVLEQIPWTDAEVKVDYFGLS